MSDRGQRRHDERRVYARRQRRTPGYVARYPNKTPGKTCSGPDCCGNPRHAVWLWKPQRGPTLQERRACQDDLATLVAEAPCRQEREDTCPRCYALACDDCPESPAYEPKPTL